MRKLFILLLIFLCFCASPPSEEDVRIQEYGELYFTMDCWWSSQELLAPTIFFCTETVSTDLISGYISLAIEEDLNGEQFFSICGRDVILNSGYILHDTLIESATEHAYNCIDAYERKLGDKFDWIWDYETSTLQLIWRPEDLPDKALTLFVEREVDSPRVLGSVYYKTGYFN